MNMKKILVVALCLLSYFAYAQPGSLSQSVYRSRVLDSAAAISANVAPIAAGYAPIFWNAQATTPGWRVWNGTSYDIGFSSGGNFWKNAGTTTLAGNVLIDGGTNDIFIDTDGDWRFGNSNSAIYTDIGALQMLWYSNAYSFLISGTLIDIQSPGNGAGVVVSTNDVSVGASDDVTISATDDITISAGGATSGHNIAISATTGSVSIASSAIAITDAASMDITANKHTLTTSSATRTFTQSYLGDYTVIILTLNTTSCVFTFPAGALCKYNGVDSGDNTLTVTGVSGDKHIISVLKNGTDYYVAGSKFGQ